MLLRNLLWGIVLMLALGGAHAANVTVTATSSLTFTPSTVTINAGDTVTFKNGGGFHNVASDTGLFRCANGCDGAGGNGNLSSAAWTATVTFNNPGTFGYFCEQHGGPNGVGMSGKVIVNGGMASPDFSIAPDANSLSVTQGNSANIGITLTPQNGFSGNVTYSASGLPAGVTAAFTAQSATRTTLTLTASTGAATGNALVQIQATSGSLSHTTSLTLTVNAATTAFVITSGITGSWYNTAQSGHGFNIEVLPGNVFLVYWYLFDNSGNNFWLGGTSNGAVSGNSATVNLTQTTGGTYPPLDPTKIMRSPWGTLTFTFTDCNNGTVAWTPSVAGFAVGSMPIQRLTSVSGQSCP